MAVSHSVIHTGHVALQEFATSNNNSNSNSNPWQQCTTHLTHHTTGYYLDQRKMQLLNFIAGHTAPVLLSTYGMIVLLRPRLQGKVLSAEFRLQA